MPHPKTPWSIARRALLAVAQVAKINEAAAVSGLSTRTVDNLISEHGRMSLRSTKPRAVALRLAEREEIRDGPRSGMRSVPMGAGRGIGRSGLGTGPTGPHGGPGQAGPKPDPGCGARSSDCYVSTGRRNRSHSGFAEIGSEPVRVGRRLHSSRGRGHVKTDQVFAGGPRACGADGEGASW